MDQMITERKTRRFRRPGSVAAGLLLATLTACGHAEAPRAHTDPNQPVPSPHPTHQTVGHAILHCSKLQEQGWSPVPSNFNTEAMASTLHVRPERIADGTVGPARCNEGLTAAAIQRHVARTILVVSGVPDHCLAIGTTTLPQADRVYRNLVVVCPGPVGGPRSGHKAL